MLVQHHSKNVRLQCQPDVAGIIEALSKGNCKTAARQIALLKALVEEIEPQVLQIVEEECCVLCDPKQSFMLLRSSPDHLRTFSFATLDKELKRLAPFISSIFSTITRVSAYCLRGCGYCSQREREAFVCLCLLY